MKLSSTPVRVLGMLGALGFISQSWAATLDQEASQLCEKYLQNFSNIRTITFTCRTVITSQDSTPAGNSISRERVVWDRDKNKLRCSILGGRNDVFVVDAKSGTLKYFNGGSTVFQEQLEEAQALAMATPFPGWLWRPEWLIPEHPAKVREEAGTIVLVTSTKHPMREIWLDRKTGLMMKFMDTDATGRVVRTVSCQGWIRESGVWVPREVEEELKGTQGSVRRTISTEIDQINGTLSESEFVLP